MHHRFFIALASLLLILSACNKKNLRADSRFEPPTTWNALADTNYAIFYPDSFQILFEPVHGTRFSILASTDGPKDRYRESIDFAVHDLGGLSIDLETYLQASKDKIEQLSSGVLFEDEEWSLRDDIEFVKIEHNGSRGKYHLHWLQYYCLYEGKVYTLTFTGEQKNLDKYADVVSKIMRSFRLTDLDNLAF
jgi:hypothetical protein